MQVIFAAMLVDAAHFAFEDREETLDRIGVDIAARPFFLGVVDGLVLGELSAGHPDSRANRRSSIGFWSKRAVSAHCANRGR